MRVITPGSYVVTVRAESYRCESKRVNVVENSAGRGSAQTLVLVSSLLSL